MIEIPFSESRVARCWIALVSKQFPQLVSFYVLGVGVGPFSRPGEAESRVRMLGPLYTYYHNLVDCHCRTIDHAPLSEKQKGMLTMRITNDGVYLGHEWVRKTRGADYDQLTSMLPLGLPVICKIIDKACSQPPDENVDWRDQIRCPMDAQAEKIWKRLDKEAAERPTKLAQPSRQKPQSVRPHCTKFKCATECSRYCGKCTTFEASERSLKGGRAMYSWYGQTPAKNNHVGIERRDAGWHVYRLDTPLNDSSNVGASDGRQNECTRTARRNPRHRP